MDIDKLKDWMDFAQKCGEGDFWERLFDGQPVPGDAPKPTAKPAAKPPVFPPVDIIQTGSETIVVAEIPGVRREELSITVYADIVRLGGVKPALDYGARPVQSERQTGPFEREIRLPHLVEGSAGSARLADGLLIIRFPARCRTDEKIRID